MRVPTPWFPAPFAEITLLWNLPEFLRPQAAPIAWVMAFDLDGTCVYDLRTSDGSYAFVTSVAERYGTIVAASLGETDVVVLKLDA